MKISPNENNSLYGSCFNVRIIFQFAMMMGLFLSQVNVSCAWNDREQLFALVSTTSNCGSSVSGCLHTVWSDMGSLEPDLGGLAWNEDCI